VFARPAVLVRGGLTGSCSPPPSGVGERATGESRLLANFFPGAREDARARALRRAVARLAGFRRCGRPRSRRSPPPHARFVVGRGRAAAARWSCCRCRSRPRCCRAHAERTRWPGAHRGRGGRAARVRRVRVFARPRLPRQAPRSLHWDSRKARAARAVEAEDAGQIRVHGATCALPRRRLARFLARRLAHVLARRLAHVLARRLAARHGRCRPSSSLARSDTATPRLTCSTRTSPSTGPP